MDVSEKIRIFRNNISDFKNENKIYLETDPIKYLPFRLTTLHNFIDLLEKYGNNDNFLSKMFTVTERIKLSLQNNKTIYHETLLDIFTDIDSYECNAVLGDFNEARNKLKNIKNKMIFFKHEIVINNSPIISLLKYELQK